MQKIAKCNGQEKMEANRNERLHLVSRSLSLCFSRSFFLSFFLSLSQRNLFSLSLSFFTLVLSFFLSVLFTFFLSLFLWQSVSFFHSWSVYIFHQNICSLSHYLSVYFSKTISHILFSSSLPLHTRPSRPLSPFHLSLIHKQTQRHILPFLHF